ncbi:MAG TPA: cob(I)yrinic acid a,c-diamide adenosyltransferase, partial [Candidatus Macondimonas sp.]|nr:cob(I)yrinic acid a,c-diamide adenosyltransferase [Candidatus Macondimonas sp.]
SKIYTRTGDTGTTGLGDGTRVPKDHQRVEAFGTVDELNALIGLLRTAGLPTEWDHRLNEIQHALFDVGGELCIPGRESIRAEQVSALESWLDQLNADLAPLKEFILPGGTSGAAWAHLARTVCRRAERRTFTLARNEPVNPETLRYLNRLSDLLFVLARAVNRHAGAGDVLWQPDRHATASCAPSAPEPAP